MQIWVPTKVSWWAYRACSEGKAFSEIECVCARVQMNVCLTAKEKWQLQHLSNYFHTERSWAGAPLLGVFVLAFCWCWAQVSHLIHDWLLCPRGTSCCPWPNAEHSLLSHTLSGTSRHMNVNTHTHKPNKLVNTICGFSIHALLSLVYTITCADMHKVKNKLIQIVPAQPPLQMHTHEHKSIRPYACRGCQQYHADTQMQNTCIHINKKKVFMSSVHLYHTHVNTHTYS